MKMKLQPKLRMILAFPVFLAFLAMAGTAWGSEPAEPPPWPDTALVADIRAWAGETYHGSEHVTRWERVLAALGHGDHADPMTSAEAQTYVDRGWGARWQPVLEALVAREAWTPPEVEAAVEVVEPETEPVTEAEPEPQLPQDAVTIEEIAAIRDHFLGLGNAKAAARWGGIVLALEGAEGGITVPELESWLADAERYGWAKGREYLPRAIATLKALAALQAWREAQEAVAPQQEDGQELVVQPLEEQEAVPQNAPELKNGKVPIPNQFGFGGTSDFAHLAVEPGADGRLEINLWNKRTVTLCVRDVANGCELPPDEWNGYPIHRSSRLGLRPHNNRPNNGDEFEFKARFSGETRKHMNYGYVYREDKALLKDGWTYAVGWDNPWPSNAHSETSVRTGEDLERWYVAAKHDGGDGWRAFGYWTESRFAADRSGMRSGNRSEEFNGGYRWVARPTGGGISGTEAFGVFVASSDPADDVSGVGGTARYEGYAAGRMAWRTQGNGRRNGRSTTFRDAPTYFTADFDAMTFDGEIHIGDWYGRPSDVPSPTVDVPTGANFAHSDPEVARGLQRWDEVGPDLLVIDGGRIAADGTFTAGCPDVAGCGNRRRPYVDHEGMTQYYEIPLHEVSHGTIGSDANIPLNLQVSELEGGFHQPGDGAPGSMMGEFTVIDGDFGWKVEGVFAADRTE